VTRETIRQAAQPAGRLDEAAERRLTSRFGPDVGDWLARLPDLVLACAERWGLRPHGPAVAGGTSVVVRCAGPGTRCVVKLTPDPLLAVQEGRALRLWADAEHVVDVLDTDERLGALLLDAVEPGEPLSRDEAWSLDHVAPLLAEVCTTEVPAGNLHGLPSLADRVEFLFALAGRRSTAAGTDRAAPPPLLSGGLARALDLARSPAPTGLVHGDLHPGNVLRAHGRGVVAIDPRPCVGDRHFDLVDWVLTPDVADGDSLRRRLAALEARVPGVDAARLRDWVVALAGLVAVPLLRSDGESQRARFLVELALT
jgi:streptomycin 6-kinase